MINKLSHTESYLKKFKLLSNKEETMAFLPFKKNKSVPDELPSLISDEIQGKSTAEKPKEIQPPSHNELVKEYLKKEGENLKPKPLPTEKPSSEEGINDQRSFFKELQSNINHEITDLDKLEEWYNNKFLPRDIVNDMRNYWEKQKHNTVIQLVGKNFQEKISEKTIKLKHLEKEWQDIYFDLIEKEEEIRNEERELKKVLSEFVELCNRKQKEQRKKR
jgi:hypothetical protein